MNPTLSYVYWRLRSALATSGRRIGRLAGVDAGSALPAAGEQFYGEAVLRQSCAACQGHPPYYLPQTATALVMALLLGALAMIAASDPEPSTWSLPVAALLAALAGVCVYYVVAKQYGPAVISADRLALARKRLTDSGDLHSPPMGLMVSLGVAGLLLVDGAFSGFSLTSKAFESVFTPRMAMWASCAWSAATAWLLWHLVSAAAHESAVNQRRLTIRNLLTSGNSDDEQQAKAMMKSIGQPLNHDYSMTQHYRARLALAGVTLMLAAATFVMRVINETDPAPMAAASTEHADPAGQEAANVPGLEVRPVDRLGQ